MDMDERRALVKTAIVKCGDYIEKVKVKQSHNRPGVVQRVPGSLGIQI
jgi:hypothetical protein